MKRLLVGLAVVAALGSAAPAEASTPMPWCGIGSSDGDRLPDATPGFAVHVAYVRPPGAADRLAEWAPRIVGDVAAIDAWWRSQDPTRSPRFDLYPFACASPFGQLDISNVTLHASRPGRSTPRSRRSASCSPSTGSCSPRRPTSSTTTARWSSSGPISRSAVWATPRPVGYPGIAIVFLQACEAEATDASPDRRRARARAHASTPSPAPRRTTAATGTSAMSPTT